MCVSNKGYCTRSIFECLSQIFKFFATTQRAEKQENNAIQQPCWLQRGLITLLSLFALGGPLAQADEAIVFYHNDIMGSPVMATDEDGNVCWREDYQPYGEKRINDDSGCGLDDNQRGFTGHVHDEDIGLTYAQARYYDPVVGRFYGIDPIGPRIGVQPTFNRYAYGNNNPYKYLDLDGDVFQSRKSS